MRLQPEQTKRIMECIAEEMGITLPGKLHLGNYEKIVINDCGLKFVSSGKNDTLILGEIITGENDFYLFPWEPKMHEEYFFPHFASEKGWSSSMWRDDNVDHRIRKTVGIYRIKKEAFQKARELGWVE